MRASIQALVVAGVVLGIAGVASAQTPPGRGGSTAAGGTNAPATGADAPVQATMHTEGNRRVYVATGTIEVRGEIQRPYAFSLSGRSSLGYSYLDVPVHFVQEIIEAVRRAPF